MHKAITLLSLIPLVVSGSLSIPQQAKAQLLPNSQNLVQNVDSRAVVQITSDLRGVHFSYSLTDPSIIGELSHLEGRVVLKNISDKPIIIRALNPSEPFSVSPDNQIGIAPNQFASLKVKFRVSALTQPGTVSDTLKIQVGIPERIAPLQIPISATATR